MVLSVLIIIFSIAYYPFVVVVSMHWETKYTAEGTQQQVWWERVCCVCVCVGG